MVIGIETAHSHPYFRGKLVSNQELVWPSEEGDTRGQAIKPLYNAVPTAIQKDEVCYKLLAGIDMLCVGQNQERLIAKEELEKYIL